MKSKLMKLPLPDLSKLLFYLFWLMLCLQLQQECLALKSNSVATVEDAAALPPAIMVDDGVSLPRFMATVKNQTITAGRAARLTCRVENLGNYKVAWVRVDTQTILTIHHNIITRNQRISLSHHDHKMWRLHINNVQESDRGWYMCQVNTDPMRSERGFLEVVVPPSIIDARTSKDKVVKEGSPVNLTCEAQGSPRPKIMWKREDGAMIRYNGGEMSTVDGNSLAFPAASRAHVGEYLCIASNGIPPSISKRIVLRVQFAPMIWVQNQLEYAILGRNVSLHCKTESYPQAIHYWRLRNGTSISSGDKYQVQTEAKKFGTLLTLTIKNVNKYDFGVYLCIAKNPLGKSDGKINLSERILVSPTRRTSLSTLATPTEVTSLGEFQPHFGSHGQEDQKQRNNEGQRIRNNNDLLYKPFPPTSTENTWDKEKAGRYPLFGQGQATVFVSKWTFITLVVNTFMFLVFVL